MMSRRQSAFAKNTHQQFVDCYFFNFNVHQSLSHLSVHVPNAAHHILQGLPLYTCNGKVAKGRPSEQEIHKVYASTLPIALL
jgi:hypothetical protein